MISFQKIQVGIPPEKMYRIVRYWDKAGTEGGGKRTAGVKLGIAKDGKLWILHVKKGQWGTAKREAFIKQTAQLDGVMVRVWVEQEPGSGGKESAENTIINLMGYIIAAERPTGDKVLRAEPFAVQVEAGNVWMARDTPDDRWNAEYLHECELFPVGQFKDQIDATSGALSKVRSDITRLEAMVKV